jgi:hypothetical protein
MTKIHFLTVMQFFVLRERLQIRRVEVNTISNLADQLVRDELHALIGLTLLTGNHYIPLLLKPVLTNYFRFLENKLNTRDILLF